MIVAACGVDVNCSAFKLRLWVDPFRFFFFWNENIHLLYYFSVSHSRRSYHISSYMSVLTCFYFFVRSPTTAEYFQLKTQADADAAARAQVSWLQTAFSYVKWNKILFFFYQFQQYLLFCWYSCYFYLPGPVLFVETIVLCFNFKVQTTISLF